MSEEKRLVKKFSLRPGRTNDHYQEFCSTEFLSENLDLKVSYHETTRKWWRAMTVAEFAYLEAHLIPPESESGQFLSPAAWYSNKNCLTNKGDTDYLVSFTYYGHHGSLVNAIRVEFASMSQATKNAWEGSAGVYQRISNLGEHKWTVNYKGENGISSIGIGATGTNPFFSTVFQNLIAQGMIKWKLEKMLSRVYREK